MSTFIVSPFPGSPLAPGSPFLSPITSPLINSVSTTVEISDTFIWDPVFKKWIMPVLTFTPTIYNPYFGEIDVLNEDYRYQDRVIDHFYTRLTEKWLFKDPEFRKLIKLFNVEKNKEKGTISLITDIDKPSKQDLEEVDRKYVFKYIEKYFITRDFVEKVLRNYVARTRVKWYDLFNNTDILKELFAHKLKKLIVSTIYDITDKSKN